MRIGITGASGLIGQAFSTLAIASGHEVVAYSRRAPSSPATPGMSHLQTPADNAYRIPETRLDALVHLAGESLNGLWTQSRRERIWKSRVDLTRSMMSHVGSWQEENRPSILLSASGIGFYGSRGDSLLDETSPPGDGFLAGLCKQWEEAARHASQWNARVVHLRTSMVLAKEGGAYPLLRRIFCCGLGGKLGTGRQWMSWIHVDDQAGLMLLALENSQIQGPLNLCAPAPELNSNFTQKLARHLHRPASLPAPAWGLRLLLRGMADEMLLCSQRGVPAAAAGQGYRFAYPRLEDALASLE